MIILDFKAPNADAAVLVDGKLASDADEETFSAHQSQGLLPEKAPERSYE